MEKTLTTTIDDSTTAASNENSVTQVLTVMDVNVRETLDMVDEMAHQSMKMTAIMIGATLAFNFIMEQAAYSTRKVRCCLDASVSLKQVRVNIPPLDLHFLAIVAQRMYMYILQQMSWCCSKMDITNSTARVI